MSKQEIDQLVKTGIWSNPDKKFMGNSNGIMSDIVGNPLTEDRGSFALVVLYHFSSDVGCNLDDEGVHAVMSDVLADMMHLCDKNGIDFQSVIHAAENHYQAELKEDNETRSHPHP